jgi:molybdopterin-guanine dinucleotide biosynthesis protein A
MGVDKALIVYHDRPQVRRLAELMERVAPPVSVSARKEQASLPGFAGLDILCDQVEGIGPLAGLLAAFAYHPESAWLVVAVDMPWITRATLEKLVLSRNPQSCATAYRNPWTEKPEPVCALYEPRIVPFLSRARDTGRYSLMLLCDVPVTLVEPADEREIRGINSPEEYRASRMDPREA